MFKNLIELNVEKKIWTTIINCKENLIDFDNVNKNKYC